VRLSIARVVGEDVHSVLGDDHGVQVTEAADRRVIESWLDREDHARLEHSVVADVEERRLMVAQSYRVAGVLAVQQVAFDAVRPGATCALQGRARL
jgi:hypothetical protein